MPRLRHASRPAPTSCTSASTRRTTTAGPRSSRRSNAACSPGPQAAGARLVVLDNLYSYGPTDGAGTSSRRCQPGPTSAKAATRAAMTDELLARPPRRAGRGRHRPSVGLLRARHHAVGARRNGLRHCPRRAHGAGDGRHRHARTATRTRPTSPAALVTLGTRPGAPPDRSGTCPLRRDPHDPGRSSTTSTGSPAIGRGCFAAAGRTTLRLLGHGQAGDARVPAARSTSSPTAGSSTTRKFRDAFGGHATPLDDALAATLQWYRRVPTLRR